MKSDPKLKWWYGRYNRDYFGGELPSSTIVYWKQELVGTKYDGDHTPGEDNEDARSAGLDAGRVPHQIGISPEIRQRDKLVRFTLLHEMVHLYLDENDLDDNSNHGRLFCREMLELAKKGAFDRLW